VPEQNPKILQKLNPQQKEAARHLDGPALVVAGPGSGKTRVLTHRIAYLIKEHKIDQSNILCVTFTNKAAGEIGERIRNLLGKGTKLSWSGTFHAICARILRKKGYYLGIPFSYVIYDRDDSVSLIKNIIKDLGMDKKKIKPYAVLAMISGAKSELIGPDDYQTYARGFFQKKVAAIYFEYQKRLKKNQALDFDDLLFETVKLLRAEPQVLQEYQKQFNYILVDEYQDTNKAQYVLTRLWGGPKKNIYVVGDMSQAIYGFRGADYRNILNFETDYPEATVYNLERNYRSTQNILDAAKRIIKNNSSHISLDLWTENGAGEKIINYTGASEYEEAQYVADKIVEKHRQGYDFNDIAVLYRTNAQSRNLEEHFIKNNIPYKIVGGTRFYSRREVKDVIAYLRVVHNPEDTISWQRIINVPRRGMGQKSVAALSEKNWDIAEIEKQAKIPFGKWLEQKESLSTMELMDLIVEDVSYLAWLDDGSDEGKMRVENIKELRTVARQFVNLAEFLENVALIESSNKANPDQFNAVTLMTAHASKGLEFPIVFIIGMEEGLFPHANSLMEKEELEEERRLCYVAITRAKEEVYLTRAYNRLYFGNRQNNMPSRFLLEIPEELLVSIGYQKDLYQNHQELEDYLDEEEFRRKNFSWQ
jgi:DNA helicase-2/ATP-dependent DNA helicase PcrA